MSPFDSQAVQHTHAHTLTLIRGAAFQSQDKDFQSLVIRSLRLLSGIGPGNSNL